MEYQSATYFTDAIFVLLFYPKYFFTKLGTKREHDINFIDIYFE